jgi:hypothetical protein
LPPLSPAQPMVRIDPAQLDLLVQRGHISPQTGLAAKAQMGLLDARLGLNPAQGFSQMVGGGGLPGVAVPGGGQLGAPPPGTPPAPPPVAPVAVKPQPKPQQKKEKLTPEQEKQADMWVNLADSIVWANPRKLPVGAHTDMSAANMPKSVQGLLQQMYPDQVKAGMVPLGWNAETLDKLDDAHKALLTKLLVMGQRERQAAMLADPTMRQQVQQAGAPVPPQPPPGGM